MRHKPVGGETRSRGKGKTMRLTEEELFSIFAFIRNHEKDDIPEDIWELSERIYEWIYENT